MATPASHPEPKEDELAVRVEDNERRRRGFPWWLLALLALALIALVIGLLFAFGIIGDDEEGAVTDVQTIVAPEDPAGLVGRSVNLEDVQVQAVLGDATFWIGPSENERVLLFFPEEQAGQAEARVNLSEGDTVTLDGTIERMPENPEQEFNFSEGDVELGGEQVYVRAASLEEAS